MRFRVFANRGSSCVVHADFMKIEPSGVLAFYNEIKETYVDRLVYACGAHGWESVEVEDE